MASYERNNWKTKSNLLPQEIKVDKTLYKIHKALLKNLAYFLLLLDQNRPKKSPTLKKHFDFLTSHNETMQFEDLKFDEFEEAFKSLKRNKAAGFDDLSSNTIIKVYDSLKNILFHVFKFSIQQGIFPDSLKIAKVTLIFKSGDKDNVNNYRPISILSIFSKVLEKIMYNRVYNHLDSKGILCEKQFGFQRINSTEHAIL